MESKRSSNKPSVAEWQDGKEKVTCLAIGDPHFQVNNVVDAKDLVKKCNLLVEQLQPTFVVILGDLLHTHEKIHVTPFNLATKLITSLARKVEVFLIIGNHDYCLAKNTPVLMWNGGIKLAQDVIVGDQLMGTGGKPRIVKTLFTGTAPLYKIEQKTASDYIVTENHTLSLKSVDMNIVDITVREYLKMPKATRDQLYGYRSNINDGNDSLIEINVIPKGVGEYFGWELEGDDHHFLLADCTVTHNCNNQQYLTSNHAFNSFKKIANVTVCDRVILRKINGLKFVFCPYVPPDRFEEALGTLEDKGRRWDDAECIFAHQEFYGCSFNPVMTSTEGDIWPEDYPLVVSGHIHNEQRLQSNIYYTGSSMQHAFGETASKTIALLTFASGENFSLQKIDLEMRKRKIVYLKVEDADKFTPEDNVYVKLVLKGSPEQFKVFRRGQTFKDLQKLGIAISFSPEGNIVQATREVQKRNVLDILGELIKNDDKYVHLAFNELKG